jgi:hypothetical protein
MISADPRGGSSGALFLVFAVATVLLLVLIAGDAVRRGQDQAFPSLLRNVWSLGVAISELDYGTKGMVGLQDVDDALKKGGFDVNGDPDRLQYVLTHSAAADKVIQEAAHLANVDRARTFIVYTNETGSVDYYEFAFRLFGHHVGGFYWLWFLMVTLVALSFLLSFRHQPIFIFPSVVFLVVLLVYAHSLDVMRLGLATPTNARCLPVTALYPIFYVLSLTAAPMRVRRWSLAAVALCGLVYAAIVNARSEALWELGAPLGIILLAVLTRRFPRLKAIWGVRPIADYALPPLAVFCVVTIGWLAGHHARQDAAAYSSATVFGHEYWPDILYAVIPFYQADIPELERRTGQQIGNNPDAFVGALTRLKIAERGETVDSYLMNGRYWKAEKWDPLCRDIVFDLWRDHPFRMLGGYLLAVGTVIYEFVIFLGRYWPPLLVVLPVCMLCLRRYLNRHNAEDLSPLLPALVLLVPMAVIATLLMPLVGAGSEDLFLPLIVLASAAASIPRRRAAMGLGRGLATQGGR